MMPWSSEGSSSFGTNRPLSPDPWTSEWFESPSIPKSGVFGLRDSGWIGTSHEAGVPTAMEPGPLGRQSGTVSRDEPATAFKATISNHEMDTHLDPAQFRQSVTPSLLLPLIPDRAQIGEPFQPHSASEEVEQGRRSSLVGTSLPAHEAGVMLAEPLSPEVSVHSKERRIGEAQKTPAARMARAHASLNRLVLNTNRHSPFSGSATTADIWQHRMREVLGSQDVKISPLQQPAGPSDRVFIAEHIDPSQAMQSTPSVPRPWQMDSHGLVTWGHFLSLSKVLKVQPLNKLITGSQWKRIYVYLNSDAKRDYINQHYFNNLVRWLPINENELHWTGLNKLHLGRQVQYVLPPSDGHDMALILDRHDRPRNGVSAFIARMTGTTDLDQSVSVWSPALFDGERYTFILYGVGQVKQDRASVVLERLEALQKIAQTNKIAYAATRGIADLSGAGHLV